MARRLVSAFVAILVIASFSLAAVLLPVDRVSAQFESLIWSTIRTPSDEDFTVVTPSEVSELVFGSSTVWYAADIPNEKLYRTADGGRTWQDDILDNLLAAEPTPTLPVWALGVAPDDPDFVVAVTDGRQAVYLSEDGGETWDCLTIASSAGWDSSILIADIAVSPTYDEQHDIAVGTRLPDTGATDGDVWVFRAGIVGTWLEQDLDMDVSSIAFSPNYDDDETIIALACDMDGTYLATGYRTTNSNTTLWQVTEPHFIEVCLTEEDSPTEDELIYSDLAVPAEYDGDSAAKRELFVSYVSTVETDDVYRIEDWRVHRLDLDLGSKIPVFSVAYQDGTLVAGEVAADAATGRARIHFCDDPESKVPEWYEPEKRPSGGFGSGVGNAIVEFVPESSWMTCATSTSAVTNPAQWASVTLPGPWSGNALGSPDESALSRAAADDQYRLFNQISLIDTDIRELCDYSLWLVGVATSPPGNTLFLATAGIGMDSIWRSTALHEDDLGLQWERVDYLDSTTDDIIMRRTPESGSGSAQFYAVRDSRFLYRSLDQGQTWSQVKECPEDLTDVAVVSGERLYVLSDELLAIGQWTEVRDWHVWRWTYEIETGLESGNTLQFYGSRYIFAGDNGETADEGKIAVSTDGGETFSLLPALPEVGPVHIVLDEEFARNKLLYAATENSTSSIYRWTLGGSTDWTTLRPPDAGFTGMGHIKGVLYGAFGAGVDRTLIPDAVTITVADWDRLTVGLTAGADFRPSTLRVTVNDMVNIWGIDGRPYDYEAKVGCLWVYADTFVLPTPWPVSPALAEVLPCDICDCQVSPFCFEWKPLPKATKWDFWIALDEEFKSPVVKVEDLEPDCCDSPGICYLDIPMSLDCDSLFYWRIRATGTTEGESVHSRWSPPMHFLVAAGSTVESMHIAPILESPEAGSADVHRTPGFSWIGFPSAEQYEFQLARDDAFNAMLAREDLDRTAYVYPGSLDWGGTYFWRVRALSPYPSEWSVASFTVLSAPVPQVVPQPTGLEALESAFYDGGTPLWVWLVIGALFLLIACVIVFTATGRRR